MRFFSFFSKRIELHLKQQEFVADFISIYFDTRWFSGKMKKMWSKLLENVSQTNVKIDVDASLALVLHARRWNVSVCVCECVCLCLFQNKMDAFNSRRQEMSSQWTQSIRIGIWNRFISLRQKKNNHRKKHKHSKKREKKTFKITAHNTQIYGKRNNPKCCSLF